jgi:CBS domain-containing protein
MMDSPFKTPEQLLAYKTVAQLLAARSGGVASVAPDSSVFVAVQLMESRDTGLLVVLDQGKMVGVISERDCARKLILTGRPAMGTPVRDVMTKTVFTVELTDTVPHCMALLTEKRIRHLPVMEGSGVIGVLSMRDLVKEILSHHERLIRDMELERMTIMNAGSGSY